MAKEKKVLFVTPTGTAAYAYFHKPDTGKKYSDNKFKGDLILDGDTDLSRLEELCRQVAEKAYPDADLSDLNLPFKSGDDHKNEEFHGKIILKAKSKYKPNIVDAKKKPLPRKVEARSGDQVRYVIALNPYDKTEKVKEGKKLIDVTMYGVSAYLQVVQLIEKRAGGGGLDELDEIDGFDGDDFDGDYGSDDDGSEVEDNGGDF